MRRRIPPLRAGLLLLPLMTLVAGQGAGYIGFRPDFSTFAIVEHALAGSNREEQRRPSRPVIDDRSVAWTRAAGSQRGPLLSSACATPCGIQLPADSRCVIRRHAEAHAPATAVTHGSSPRSPPPGTPFPA